MDQSEPAAPAMGQSEPAAPVMGQSEPSCGIVSLTMLQLKSCRWTWELVGYDYVTAIQYHARRRELLLPTPSSINLTSPHRLIDIDHRALGSGEALEDELRP
ncbi:hypothetical protein E2P81_ATG12113 [Venturia nashicola]|nr:hypothetical protein E2P81_ATG12113 [Venturia nashicola]